MLAQLPISTSDWAKFWLIVFVDSCGVESRGQSLTQAPLKRA
jgi:hypothetical protein